MERAKRKTMTLLIPPDEMDALNREAILTDRSKTEVCRIALKLYHAVKAMQRRGESFVMVDQEGTKTRVIVP